jgi:hypothetical protein
MQRGKGSFKCCFFIGRTSPEIRRRCAGNRIACSHRKDLSDGDLPPVNMSIKLVPAELKLLRFYAGQNREKHIVAVFCTCKIGIPSLKFLNSEIEFILWKSLI